MPYVKGLEFGQFRGLAAAGGTTLWLTDAKLLKRELEGISWTSAQSTYDKLEKRFIQMKTRGEQLIEDPVKKGAVITHLGPTLRALPMWHAKKPEPAKTWFSTRLIKSLDQAIKIVEGRVPVYTRVVEKVVQKVVEVPVPAIVTPTAPPEKEPEGISTTTLLIGLGALTAGYFLFLKKK